MTDLIEKKCKNCEEDTIPLNEKELNLLLESINKEWLLNTSRKAISRRFTFPIYSKTIAFVNAVAWIATDEGHHPEILFGYNYCEIKYSTHAIQALTENDFICAAKIDLLVNKNREK